MSDAAAADTVGKAASARGAPPARPAAAHDEGAHDAPAAAELESLRAGIEAVDRQLIELLAQRVELARQAGLLKRAAGLPVLDPAREAAVVRRAGELARARGVGDEDVRYIFWHVIGLSRRAQLSQ